MRTAQEIRKWMDTVDVDNKENWNLAKMYIGAFDQIKWERDVAMEQLKNNGIQFGAKLKEETIWIVSYWDEENDDPVIIPFANEDAAEACFQHLGKHHTTVWKDECKLFETFDEWNDNEE